MTAYFQCMECGSITKTKVPSDTKRGDVQVSCTGDCTHRPHKECWMTLRGFGDAGRRKFLRPTPGQCTSCAVFERGINP